MLRSVGHDGTFEGSGLLLQLLVGDAYGPAQVGIAQVGPAEVGPAQVSFHQPFGEFARFVSCFIYFEVKFSWNLFRILSVGLSQLCAT
jgi:hypothetical protein